MLRSEGHEVGEAEHRYLAELVAMNRRNRFAAQDRCIDAPGVHDLDEARERTLGIVAGCQQAGEPRADTLLDESISAGLRTSPYAFILRFSLEPWAMVSRMSSSE